MITILIQMCLKNEKNKLIPIAVILGLLFDIMFASILANSIRGIL